MDEKQPLCPVGPQEKEWIEYRMSWLVHQFGWARLRSVEVILPTPKYFPDPFNGDVNDVQPLLKRICQYMELDPQACVEAELYYDDNVVHDEHGRQGTAGFYDESAGKFRIWIEAQNLEDPLGLIATMAHEVGHVFLLGQGRLSRDVQDHEPLTDLLTVFLGMGVFTANSVVREQRSRVGAYTSWSVSRNGYLSMEMYGYALALFAWCREETAPIWANELRPDVRSPFEEAMKFLSLTGDSAIRPGHVEPVASGSASPIPLLAQTSLPAVDPFFDDELSPSNLVCPSCGEELDPVHDGTLIQLLEQYREAPDEAAQAMLCQACCESIEDNEREMREEVQAYERSEKLVQNFMLIGLLLLAGFCILIWLWYGFRQS